MKINWAVRFKNKVWLTSLVMFLIGTVYQLLGMFDVIPAFPQEQAVEIASAVLNLLGLIGIIADPTTDGLKDSERAMSYVEPWKDPVENG